MNKAPRWRSLLFLFVGLFSGTASVAAPFAYIPRTGGVSVIDVQSHAIVAEAPLDGPRGWIAVHPGSPYAYVTAGAPVTSLYRVQTSAQQASSFPRAPENTVLASNPVRPAAYVVRDACEGGGTCFGGDPRFIEAMDTDTGGATAGKVLGSATNRMYVDETGQRLFMSDFAGVDIRDATTLQRVSRVALDGPVLGVVKHPSLDRLYAAGSFALVRNTIHVVDTASGLVVARIVAGNTPSDLAITPSGARLFVTNKLSDTVSVIDTATHQVIATIPVGTSPEGIDITPLGDFVYVVNTGSGSVSVISTDTLAVVATISVGAGARAIGRFIGGPTPADATQPGVLTGLWWNPSEPGWGIHMTLRRNTVFAAWFTYGSTGGARWYVASECTMNVPLPCATCVEGSFCNGRLYEVSGPPFLREPFLPGAVHATDVGLVQIHFASADRAEISYGVRGETRGVGIRKQLFAEGPVAGTNYTDLWWNPRESGWGMGITHQGGVMFLTWFVYAEGGGSVWYVASNCTVHPSGKACNGPVYRASGHPGPHGPGGHFDSSRVTLAEVGSIEVVFTDDDNGMLSYVLDGVRGSKAITRQLF